MLRSNLGAMDREKDSLQSAVDEKTEKIAQLNGQLHDRVSKIVNDKQGWDKVGHIVTEWDKSTTFSHHISVHFGSPK